MYSDDNIGHEGSMELDQEELHMDHHLWGYLQPCNSLVARIDLWRNRPTCVLGRNPESHIILTGSRISYHHCDISWDGVEARKSVVTVTDRSSNGTFINGIKIGKGNTRILREGNELSLATVTAHLDPNQDFRFIYRHLAGGQPTTGLYASYDLSHELGKGAYATVMKAVERSTGKWYAVKIINEKHHRSLESNRTFKREIDIMMELQHENIVQLKEFFLSEGRIELVLELVEGGDLLAYILDRNGLDEITTRHFTYQMCRALSYIHGKGITHRDLKPENVLLTKDQPPVVKIADFGLAKVVHSETMLRTMCGTPTYLAPEVVTQKVGEGYTNKVDSWSVGVIIFSMLTNVSPFVEDLTQRDIRMRILGRHVDWSILENISASTHAQDFIHCLLEPDPVVRLSLTDSFNHPWLSSYTPSYGLDTYNDYPSISSIDSQDFSMLTSMSGFNPNASLATNIYAMEKAAASNYTGPPSTNINTSPIQRRAHILSKAEHENLNILEPSKEMYENSIIQKQEEDTSITTNRSQKRLREELSPSDDGDDEDQVEDERRLIRAQAARQRKRQRQQQQQLVDGSFAVPTIPVVTVGRRIVPLNKMARRH